MKSVRSALNEASALLAIAATMPASRRASILLSVSRLLSKATGPGVPVRELRWLRNWHAELTATLQPKRGA